MKDEQTSKQNIIKGWSFENLLLEFYRYAPAEREWEPEHYHDEYQFCLSVDCPGEYYYRGTHYWVPTVAAWLHDPQTIKTAYEGDAGVQRRITAAQAARKEFEKTGKVEYIPATSRTDRNVAMFNSDYYNSPNRGEIPQWKNQFAVMSWSEWLEFNALSAAPKVNIPTLFVHTDKSAFPNNVRRFYNTMPEPKDLFWTQGVHSDFYDRMVAAQL